MEKVKQKAKKIIEDHLAPQYKYLAFVGVLLLVAALVLTWFMEYRYFVNDFGRTWQFLFERPLVFLYNAFLMFWLLLLLVGITRRPFISIGIMLSVIWGLGYIQINKQIMRGTPLLPEDFQLASEVSSLTKFVDWWSILGVILLILITMSAAIVLEITMRKYWFPRKTERSKIWWKRHMLVPRIAIIAVACLGFLLSSDFARNHQGSRYQQIPWLGSEFVAWNQTRNYDYNGFLLGFLYNWSKFKLAEPNGYSEQKMQEIVKEYTDKKSVAEKNSQLVALNNTDYNIVVILNESFYDPDIISEYYKYSGENELLPNLKRITSKYPSGQMYSLDYGGGTANIEFETLTGLTNYWANTVPYTDLIPKAGQIPSIASYAKANGYETVAIHPFNGGMYKRNIALKNEGFDEFITEIEMKHTDHVDNSQYISDESAYKEVLEILKRDSKQMIGLITMQNHTPYYNGIYNEDDFEVEELDDEWEQEQIESFLQTMHYSDQYLGNFIDELEKLNEKTVVLFFGDHSPGIFSKVNYHEDKSVRDLSRLTPYFIYTNFDMDSQAESEHIELPTTTPNCLTNTLFDVLKLQKPALWYLTAEVCQETPILTPAYFGESAPFQSTTLSNYELVTYDILGGKQYWNKFIKE